MTSAPVLQTSGRVRLAGVHSETEAEYVRFSVNLARDVADELRRLADESGVTITETVRRAINLLSIVDQALDEGARVQLVTETDRGREIETLRFL